MLTDAMLITLYAFLTVLTVVATAIFAVHRMHQTLSYNYYGISACVFGWLMVTFAYHFTTEAGAAEYLDNLTFPFIAFLPIALLQFMLFFYRDGLRISRKGILLLCIVPAITTIISVVPSLNWLLRSNYTMLQFAPLHISSYSWNVWFYVHAVYSYLLILLGCVLVLLQYKKQPPEYRIPSILMFLCVGVAFFSDLPSFFIPESVIDHTLVGVSISMTILYVAVINNPTVAFLTTARKALYNNLELPVFIMNRQEYIVDMNSSAHAMMRALDVSPEDVQRMAFGDVSGVLSALGGRVKEGYSKDGLPHIFLTIAGENVVFKQVRRDLTDKRGKRLGSYVVMMEITGLRRMIDDLQYNAEVDVLTGIPNRRAYEKKLAALDVPHNLPISFIVGDVNRLKQVNDKFGHKQGDKLLQVVARVLAEKCPERGFVARIGGDEFILLIPRCGEEEARMVMNTIHVYLNNEAHQFMDASIALGCVTKTRPEQDVHQLIHEADQLMYSQKKYDRRGGMQRSV